jgi:hypothetical protein
MLHPHTRALVVNALAALDSAAQELEDSCNVALADLPERAEHTLLSQIAGAVVVIRAVVRDYRTTAAEIWPES